MALSPLPLVLLWTLVFLAVHVGVAWWLREEPFKLTLRVSRGLAAAILVLAGLVALARWWPAWRYAFLRPETTDSPAFGVAVVLLGHLVADMIWLGWGWRAKGETPRFDLVLHHLLGLAAFSAAAVFDTGYTLLAVIMTTEIMPVTTGLGAWGRVAERRRVERLAVRLGYLSLLLWRVPLWIFLGAVCGSSALGLSTAIDPGLHPASVIATVAAVLVLLLDVYWGRKYHAQVRRLTEDSNHPFWRAVRRW